MTRQTLFGKEAGKLQGPEASGLETEIEHTLPVEVNPKILEGLDEVAVSFICAVANSTARDPSGREIPYAAPLRNEDYLRKWSIEVLNTTEQGRERIRNMVAEVYGDFYELVQKGQVNPVLYGLSEEYPDSEAGRADIAVYEKAQQGKLAWDDLLHAKQNKSYIWKAAPIDQLYLEPTSPKTILPKCLGRVEIGHSNLLEYIEGTDIFRIPDVYIGGNRYDAGAKALVTLVESCRDLNWGTETFRDLEPLYAHIEGVYGSITFLEAQGYSAEAKTLREQMREKFLNEFYSLERTMAGPDGELNEGYISQMHDYLVLAERCDDETYEQMAKRVWEQKGTILTILQTLDQEDLEGDYREAVDCFNDIFTEYDGIRRK